MAMHNSSELHDVIKVVTEQLSGLGIKFDHANFSKIDAAGNWDLWISTTEQAYPSQVHFPYFDHRVFNQLNDLENTTLDFFTDLYTAEEKNIFFRKFFETTEARNIPEERKQYVLNDKGMARSFFRLKNMWFSMGKYDDALFTDEENNIFRRFAVVFEQSYTRFLDLQKAEAQVREARIEAGLERARSRAMAMQTSEELNALIGTVFSELTKLDLVLTRCVILIYEGNEKGVRWWMANSEAPSRPMNFFVKYADIPFFNEYLKGWQERSLKWQYILEGENKFVTDEFLFKETELSQLPDFVITGMRAPDRVYLNASFNNFGNLTLASLESLSDEHFDILLRFAKVFDLTYTRFNDLQQAEAQAREAHIEAALERVRARSMAMHHSSELHEAADVLFQQLRIFGGNIMNAGIALCKQDSDEDEYWLSSDSGLRPVISIPHTEDPIQKKLYEDWKNKSEFYSIAKGGDELRAHYNYLQSVPGLKPFFEEGPDWSFPTWQKWHAAYFSHGYLFMITLEPYEEEKILVRFARVFEQAYTRFLDLKKAEAQAREAQIELALERVRARTMAMQKSDELAEAAQLLYHEFGTLGINTITCGYMFIDEEKNIQTAWTALPDGTLLPNFIDFPLTGDHVLNKRYEDWQQKKPLHILEIQGKVNKEHHRFLSDYVPAFVIKEIFSQLPDKIVFHCANFSSGYLLILATDYFSPDDQQTIIRFAKVFEMTYRRFLDLKMAEAQVRESQIQLALERVRARTMAMHKSEELAETVYVLFQQFKELGENPDQATIGIVNEDEKVIEYWVTMYGKPIDKVFKFSVDEPNVTNKIYKAWKENKRSLMIDLTGEALKEFMIYRVGKGGAAINPNEKRRIINVAFFSKGLLNVQSKEERSEESIKLLERFASVFEQTYTRFLDLQKAEAQARESQIEAALERVRSKTMAMHNSHDVGETVATMFAEFIYLGIYTNRCGILIFNDQYIAEVWTARSTPGGNAKLIIGKLDLDAHKMLRSVYNAWNAKGTFYQYDLLDNDLVLYYTAINNSKFYPTQFDLNALPSKEFHSDFLFADGAVFSFTNEPVAEEHAKIIKRFALVFGQTYRRYLDLQKAEAQTRESQIQLSLERVRARAMAMHGSDELNELVKTLFEELIRLDVKLATCLISTFDISTLDVTSWMFHPITREPYVKRIPYNEQPFYHEMLRAWKERNAAWNYCLEGETKVKWNNFLFTDTEFALLPQSVIDEMQRPDKVFFTASYYQGVSGENADRGEQQARAGLLPALQSDRPVVRIIVPMRGSHRAVELHVAPQVEFLGHEVEVFQRVGLWREMLFPVPLLQQLLGKE